MASMINHDRCAIFEQLLLITYFDKLNPVKVTFVPLMAHKTKKEED